jgi:hypothetical protein
VILRPYWLVLKLLGIVVLNYYALHWAFYCLNQDSDAWVLSGITVLVLLISADFGVFLRWFKRTATRIINSELVNDKHENKQTPTGTGDKH